MRTAAVFVALAAALASAEDEKKSPVEEFDITPGNVELRSRSAWCIGERNTCIALCPGRPKKNRCDIDTLEYSCTCANGTEPGLQYYDSSLFSLVCQEAFKQCTATNAGDPVELPKCKDDIQARCGTLSISDLPDEETEGSGEDKSGGDEESGKDGESNEGGGDDKEEEGEGAGVVLRPAWGTAVVGAAIGAVAIFI